MTKKARPVLVRQKSELELPLLLDRTDPRALHLQLAQQWRAAILDGRLGAHSRLPSSRVLAQALHVSRHVVLLAVDELMIEGYLTSRQGSGVRVSSDVGLAATADAPVPDHSRRWQAWPAPPSVSDPPLQPGMIEFRLGEPGLDRWSNEAWRRVWRDVGRNPPPAGYGDPQGEPELREAIAAYLGRARGLRCSARQVLITSGSLAALHLLAQAVVRPGELVGLEDPGYRHARQVLLERGAQVRPYEVDDDGLRVDALPCGQAAPILLYCTPSHQYPLGGRLSLPRRQALLAWAEREDVLLVEDDYDSEFRFDTAPLPALKALDTAGTVAYLGTFSKSLTPALRVGYLVGSPTLIERLVQFKRLMDGQVAWPMQQALALWVGRGQLDHYIGQMRREYARKRAVLAEVFTASPNVGRLIGLDAGFHVFLELPPEHDARDVVAACQARGVNVQTLEPFYLGPAARQGLLLGYGTLSLESIRQGGRVIVEVLETLGREKSSG